MRRPLPLFALLAVAAVVWVATRGERTARTGREEAPAAGQPAAASEEVPAPEAPRAALFAGLAAALDGPAGPDAAARLRALLRTDAAARRGAEEALLDLATDRDLRMALALVLGTIGASDDVLLAALDRFGGDDDLVRCLLLALGAARDPPEDDEVFDLGDRPWGVRGPGGLGITVRRAVAEPHVRAALALGLDHPGERVRLAAAKALRHSLEHADARDAFLRALDREAADGVLLEIGEALAGWAAGPGEGTARADVLRSLLARAADEGLDGYRFRLENDLARLALGPGERAVLREYTHPARPFGTRAFALTVLASGAGRSGEAAVEEARGVLEEAAARDPDGAVRDLAARLLARLPYDADTLALLARLSREDPAWNRRYTAVEAVAELGARPEVLAALRLAMTDVDRRVAERARELHDRLDSE